MARSERQVPSVYFGRPGALITMPWPRGDLDKPYDRQVFDFVTGSGQHAVSVMATGSRPFQVKWNALHLDTFNKISQYWYGANGVGPWCLIDPSAPNLLLPNQAAAGSQLNDTTGWMTLTAAAGMGTILTSSVELHRVGGTRSIRWQFPVTAAGPPTITFVPPYRNWYGIPVMTGLPYTWSVWAKPDGVLDSSIQMATKFQWLDAAGTQLSEVSGGDVVVTGWTQLSVTGNPHASAVYLRPVLSCLGASITVGASVYIDEPMLEQDSVVNTWAPGTGVRPVEIIGLTETAPFEARFRRDLTLMLRELAA